MTTRIHLVQIQWAYDCLNTKCDGKNRVFDCPITNKNEARRLLKAYNDKKKTDKKSTKQVKATDNGGDKATNDKRRLPVLLEDKVESVVLGDSGADMNDISSELLHQVLHV